MGEYEALRARHRAEFEALVPVHQERLTWDAERIALERRTRLRHLLSVARARSRWHRARLADIDVDEFTEADLGQLPVMTKDDMMLHFDDVVTDTRVTRELAEAHLATLVEDAYLLDEFHVFASGGSSGRRGIFVQDWQGGLWLSLALSRFFVRQRAQLGLDRPRPRWSWPPARRLI